MDKPKKFQGRAFEFYEDHRGFYYMRLRDGEDVLDEDIVALNDWIQIEGSGQKKPMLIEMAYGTTVSPGVQAYLSENQNRFSTADALLISTFAHKLLATFYLRHYKPSLPTRVFQDVFDALEWINTRIAADQNPTD